MIVLGIDPGSRVTGWGLVQTSHCGRELLCIDYGNIRPSPKLLFQFKLQYIFEQISGLLEQYHPEAVAVESVFQKRHKGNYGSALKLGHARACALLAASLQGLPVHEYPPADIKKAVVGYGRAEKLQIRGMVATLLGLEQNRIPQDAADALAVAICHSFKNLQAAKL